ncbi:MAG: hypothetical protein NVS3B26_29630 [Mycobacteriales bacterium]
MGLVRVSYSNVRSELPLVRQLRRNQQSRRVGAGPLGDDGRGFGRAGDRPPPGTPRSPALLTLVSHAP